MDVTVDGICLIVECRYHLLNHSVGGEEVVRVKNRGFELLLTGKAWNPDTYSNIDCVGVIPFQTAPPSWLIQQSEHPKRYAIAVACLHVVDGEIAVR